MLPMQGFLVRSKADPTIIAFVHDSANNSAIKIKASDTPYPGEDGRGTEFNWCNVRSLKYWRKIDENDTAAVDCLLDYLLNH